MRTGLVRLGPLALGALLLAAVRAPAASQSTSVGLGEPRVFSHTTHVPELWAQGAQVPEVARDCRGCHDYSSPRGERREVTVELCDRCHHYQNPTWQGTLDVGVEGDDDLFDHYDHRAQECRTCHAPPGGAVPEVMPIPSLESAGSCASCHGPDGVAAERRAAFNRGLNTRYEERDSELGAFRHDRHPGDCATCHGDMVRATADNLGERQFTTATCASCHLGVEFRTETYEKASAVGATFHHRFHVDRVVPSTGERLECLDCHAWEPDPESGGTYGLGERFAGDAHDGCVTCHETWEVDRHGETGRCQECHDLAPEVAGQLVRLAGMGERRARAEVVRPMPIGFAIGAQAHPEITGGAVADECRECHVAEVPELPSRVSGEPFDHAVHLGPEWRAEPASCEACHASMRGAGGPSDLTTLVPEGRSPTLWSEPHCGTCHLASTLEPRFEPRPAAREVLRFSHLDHLERRHPETGRVLACLDCHVAAPEGLSAGLRLAPGVEGCAECHGHDERRAPSTGDWAFTAGGGDCTNCHRLGLPASEVAFERLRLTSIRGNQRHEGTGSCTECHRDVGTAPASAPPRRLGADGGRGAGELTYVRENAMHRPSVIDSNPGGVYFYDFPEGDPRNRACFDCHWHKIGRAFVKSQAFAEAMEQHDLAPRGILDTAKMRREFGELGGYPGFAEPPVRRLSDG